MVFSDFRKEPVRSTDFAAIERRVGSHPQEAIPGGRRYLVEKDLDDCKEFCPPRECRKFFFPLGMSSVLLAVVKLSYTAASLLR